MVSFRLRKKSPCTNCLFRSSWGRASQGLPLVPHLIGTQQCWFVPNPEPFPLDAMKNQFRSVLFVMLWASLELKVNQSLIFPGQQPTADDSWSPCLAETKWPLMAAESWELGDGPWLAIWRIGTGHCLYAIPSSTAKHGTSAWSRALINLTRDFKLGSWQP